MKDYKIYGEVSKAPAELVKSLTGFTIESVSKTENYEAHYFDDDTGEEEIYKGRSVEGGLTLILTKGSLKKKVILGYTELGEWLENEEIL